MSELEPGLVDRVRRRVVESGAAPTPGRVAAAFRQEGGLRGDAAGVVAALTSEIVGAGPLAGLLADATTTDVLVNAPDEVWVDRGDGLLRTAVRFTDENAVRRLAQRMAASA